MFNETMAQARGLLESGVGRWGELHALIHGVPEGASKTILEEYVKSHTSSWAISWDGDLRDGHGAKLVYCPPGQFLMGASENDPEAFDDEKPQHKIIIPHGLCVFDAPITQAHFFSLMGYNPSHFKGKDNHPVEQVNWHEAAAFCNVLSREFGLSEVYDVTGSGKDVVCTIKQPYPNTKLKTGFFTTTGFRLPTEAEWEYVCRAGCEASRYGNIDDIAWYAGNSKNTTHPVKQKQPNAWGLHDTLGNVWEWCYDTYNENAYQRHRLNHPITNNGASRVVRGGRWFDDSRGVRASCRSGGDPSGRSQYLGFRPVRFVLP